MQYAGSKQRLGKTIVEFLHDSIRRKSGTYLEPFVGSCAVLRRVKAPVRIAGDKNSDIIYFWQAIQNGYVPPDSWDKESYDYLRDHPYLCDHIPHLRGFLFGFCGFGGKWQDSFARNSRGYDFVGAQHRDALRVAKKIKNVNLYAGDYNTVQIENGTIYCDPPYANTSNGYKHSGFDHNTFWQWVKHQALEYNNDVFVSEYTAPEWAKTIWVKDVKMIMAANTNTATRTERLFLVNRETYLVDKD